MENIAPAIAAHAVAATTITFVPPDALGTRIATVLTIVHFCASAMILTNKVSDEGQAYAEYMFGFVLHANVFLVLMRMSAPMAGTTMPSRLRWALTALFTPRRMLPQRRTQVAERSRQAFCLQSISSALIMALIYLGLRSNSLLPVLMTFVEIAPSKDSLVLQTWSGTLTQRVLIFRAEVTAKAIFMPAVILAVIHKIFAVLAVGLFGSAPSSWPPLFGNILDAYSLGRWYSHFWEKLMRKGFTMNAAFIVQRICGIPVGDAIGRTFVILLSFFFSGLMHTAASWTPGPCGNWKPFWAYLATGVAILVERALCESYIRGHRILEKQWSKTESLLWRLFGYCWVALWWLEVLPRVIFPATRCYLGMVG